MIISFPLWFRIPILQEKRTTQNEKADKKIIRNNNRAGTPSKEREGYVEKLKGEKKCRKKKKVSMERKNKRAQIALIWRDSSQSVEGRRLHNATAAKTCKALTPREGQRLEMEGWGEEKPNRWEGGNIRWLGLAKVFVPGVSCHLFGFMSIVWQGSVCYLGLCYEGGRSEGRVLRKGRRG